MVKSMLDIRSCKKMIGILIAVVLLSFFGVVQEKMPVNTAAEMLGTRQCATYILENESADVAEIPDRGTRITTAKSMLDEVMMRQQRTTRVIQIRFIAVVCMLLCAIWVVYRITIRRFGCLMIDLWENITYIHQIDGAKGKGLLYT